MADTRTHLLACKHDLLAALRVLEQDHEDGTLDEQAYVLARQRYEAEAAHILERLDDLPEGPDSVTSGPLMWIPVSPRLLGVGAAGLVVLAMALFLGTALRDRESSSNPTGDVGGTQPPPQVSVRIAAARTAVLRHPDSVDALLSLGNAYLATNSIADADRAYRGAMSLDSGRPEPVALHAMVLGSTGHRQQALALLSRTEHAHPRFARAWLIDGLIASNTSQGLHRAITAWRRFLRIAPRSPVSTQVRLYLAAAKNAARGKP